MIAADPLIGPDCPACGVKRHFGACGSVAPSRAVEKPRTAPEKVALNRISVGLSPIREGRNYPAVRDMMKRLERDKLVDWSPKGWTLTDKGKGAIA